MRRPYGLGSRDRPYSTPKQGKTVAKEKIFHVVRKSDGSEHLVRAAKDSGVLVVLAGNAWKPSIAMGVMMAMDAHI